MPDSVTEPLSQLLSWTAWLAGLYMLIRAIHLAPQFAFEYREGRRGATTKKFAYWILGAILVSSAGTMAQVILA